MKIGLSTNWNSHRHEDGSALVDEALELGFDALELGYNCTEEMAAQIKARNDIAVDSVHAYCPVPFNAPHGYPELHLLASPDEDERVLAALLLKKSLATAVDMNAKRVVLHAGRIFLDSFFGSLSSHVLEEKLEAADKNTADKAYQKLFAKARARRAKRTTAVAEPFAQSLETLLPLFEKEGITLCLENLPSLEAYPDEDEIVALRERFAGAPLMYWYDIGHGQVRQNMGWISSNAQAVCDLLPHIGGCHIHDCAPLAHDHLAPGKGGVDWPALAPLGNAEQVVRVFEPSPRESPAEIRDALAFIRKTWSKQ